MKNVRLILASSSAHLLNVEAILRSLEGPKRANVILDRVDSSPSALRERMAAFARAMPESPRFVSRFRPILDLNGASSSDWQSALAAHAEAFRQEIGDITEIWVWSLLNPDDKAILEAFPEATIRLYDDGLLTHQSQAMIDCPRPGTPEYRRAIATSGTVIRQHVERLESAHIILDGILPLPSHLESARVEIITASAWQAALQRYLEYGACRPHVPLGIPSNKPTALVIGSSLHRYKLLTYLEERRVYERVIRHLIDAGHFVLWRDHHRIREPFAGYLKTRFARGQFAVPDSDQGVPIEAIGLLQRIDLVTSISSTAQFSFKWLYGSKAFGLRLPEIDYENQPSWLQHLRFPIDLLPALTVPGTGPTSVLETDLLRRIRKLEETARAWSKAAQQSERRERATAERVTRQFEQLRASQEQLRAHNTTIEKRLDVATAALKLQALNFSTQLAEAETARHHAAVQLQSVLKSRRWRYTELPARVARWFKAPQTHLDPVARQSSQANKET